ncbi:MAG: dTDP-4-dehydrorhamnose reductase [Betaproteobacteria bacterium]|jgi:dTDP-4-dehydrorhamnose reductase|nr:dTDP-4-dehydrorhamnose reductase [Betaproteobacteria bacterium]
MKVLVLGGDGMLGHELYRELRHHHETGVTLRQQRKEFSGNHVFAGVEARGSARLEEVIAQFRPAAVINCIGIVKQRAESEEAILSIEVNALLPHRLALACRAAGARLIQLSTDCVFSGDKGRYREEDRPDPVDLYGRSKLLGEVTGTGELTLRTSMIGLGLYRKTSLVDWFLAQKGKVEGYRKAIFSGLTTRELSRVLRMIVEKHPQASGLYHLSAAPIDKHELLVRLRERLAMNVDIVPVDQPCIDRSLDSTRFRRVFAWQPPAWDAMLDELAVETRKAA